MTRLKHAEVEAPANYKNNLNFDGKDERLIKYAKTIVNQVNAKAGEQIWVNGPAGAKELLLEIQKELLCRGAYPDLDVYFEESIFNNLYYSGIGQLSRFGPVDKVRTDTCDKHIIIWCLDDYVVDYTAVDPKKLETRRITNHKNTLRLDEVLSVGADYPTPQRAKLCGMEWEEYLDFFYNAVNIDLKKLYDSYRWLENMLNQGKVFKIQSQDTDLTIGIEGRPCISDVSNFYNLPDGELFLSPLENSVEGYISFKDKQVYQSSVPVEDLHIKFEKGRLIDFSASAGREFFSNLINTDEGAKVLGELGIGINPGVTAICHYDLFDEKILGTVHLALGNGFIEAGSKNKSAVHWDLIKDLREDGRILIDGVTVFEKGRWLKR